MLDRAGCGSYAGVIAGIDWVTANAVKPAVANMSLGSGASSTVDDAVCKSIASGVTYAVAAGDSNADACNYSPARTAEAITVGATTNTDARASYSNYGTCLDIFAPGSSITSVWYTGDTTTSTISIADCTGYAGSTATVEVHINHTYRGDLVIDLIAPDGSAYRLKNSSSCDSADNVDATYTVNLSAETAAGSWTLDL